MFTTRLIYWMTNLVLGFIEIVLALRILFRLIGAGTSPFVAWIYDVSQPLLAPFEGILPTTPLPAGAVRTSMLEFSALIALLFYGLIGYLIGELLAYFTYRRTTYLTEDEVEEYEEAPVRRRRIRR